MHKIFQIVILFTSTFHWTKTFYFRSFWTYSNFFLGFFQHTKKNENAKSAIEPYRKIQWSCHIVTSVKRKMMMLPFFPFAAILKVNRRLHVKLPNSRGGKCHVVFIQKMHKELIVMCSNGKKMCTYILCVYVMFDYLYTLFTRK